MFPSDLSSAEKQREELQKALRQAQNRRETIEEMERAWQIAGQLLQLEAMRLGESSMEDRRRLYMALRLRVEIGQDGILRLSGIFDPAKIRLLDVLSDPPDVLTSRPKVGERPRVVVASGCTPSCDSRTDNAPHLRFCLTLGVEPEVEVALL